MLTLESHVSHGKYNGALAYTFSGLGGVVFVIIFPAVRVRTCVDRRWRFACVVIGCKTKNVQHSINRNVDF